MVFGRRMVVLYCFAVHSFVWRIARATTILCPYFSENGSSVAVLGSYNMLDGLNSFGFARVTGIYVPPYTHYHYYINMFCLLCDKQDTIQLHQTHNLHNTHVCGALLVSKAVLNSDVDSLARKTIIIIMHSSHDHDLFHFCFNLLCVREHESKTINRKPLFPCAQLKLIGPETDLAESIEKH